MLQITKIFNFEMAHALYGYDGPCKDIHGHSYVLHVTVTTNYTESEYLGGTGIILDFKELKRIIGDTLIQKYDHGLVLSKSYLKANPNFSVAENLVVWDFEPSAENILLYFKNELDAVFPGEMRLVKLKLYETNNSFAEWTR
jgi:6-pyruvoyltetrahydropterin/6-carboxytetrahydropterin synthase